MTLQERLNKKKLESSIKDVAKTTPENKEDEVVEDPYLGYKNILRADTIKIINENQPDAQGTREELVRNTVNALILEREYPIDRGDREEVINEVVAEIIGLGPLDALLRNDDVSEIMVNGPDKIYIEEKGKLHLSNVHFNDNAHVMVILDRIVSPLGRHVDESSPMVDARLADGSRVNAIIPPLALNGPTITIRKFPKSAIRSDDLIRFGSVTTNMMAFLEACVKGKLNIIVSGGTGSGKTTFLGALSAFIPNNERIVTIEDAAELQLQQDHVVRLESRPANMEGKGAVKIQDLVVNALRMRPDRIVVGECRGGEALDMLQAMNTGHDGSLTTGHANSPRDMISRLETMVLMSGTALPDRAIKEQIASAINIIVQQSRLPDGSRKVTNITEITGMEGEEISMQDIFKFQREGRDVNGKIKGRFVPTGIRPACIDKLMATGINVRMDWFNP